MKLLIVEDEPDLLDIIMQSLLKESFVVESASDFSSAMDKTGSYEYRVPHGHFAAEWTDPAREN